MKPFRVLMLVALLAAPSFAADGFYKIDVAGAGGTGFRWRPVGGSSWTTVPLLAGKANVDPGEGVTTFEYEIQGINYGRSTFSSGGLDLSGGDVNVSVGGLTATSSGLARSVTMTQGGSPTSVFQSFSQGADGAFDAAMVADFIVSANTPFGLVISAAVGAFLLWLVIRRGLRWCSIAFSTGGGEVSDSGGDERFVGSSSLASRFEK